jgi:precorrin-6B C5,15-methyltransferase / cobalt-precorrin-6B C5,C15-methyltransferase
LSSSAPKVFILGIGDDGLEGLTASARQRLEDAELILGPDRSLSMLRGTKGKQVPVGNSLEELLRHIREAERKRVVVLQVGDPLFYGTARFLFDRLGKERFEVLPHVSSMQLAFARVKENWDEAYQANLAMQPLELVVEKIRVAGIAGLFTTEEIPPAAVAKALLDRKIDYFTAYICENLGSPDERVTQAELASVADETYSPLNVMILVRKPDVPDRPAAMRGKRLFGNPDEFFLQSKPKRGLLTPAEVRAIALAELDLGPTSTLWDVGAGSGSVAIEGAQIAAAGQVFAIEMDPEDYQLIIYNAEQFRVPNLTAILGRAPEAWEKLPKPDAVFIGGSGRDVSVIAEKAFAELRPGGRIVVNVGSVENLSGVRSALAGLAGEAQVWMVQVSRGTEQMERMRFESLNPTFLLKAVKGT